MSTLKSVLALSLVGAFLGAVGGTLFGRAFLPWYNTPGDGAQALALYESKLVLNIIDSLVRYQLIGALTGALAFAVLTLVYRRARNQPPPGSTQAPPLP